MIRHVVFFSVKEGEDAEAVFEGLSVLTSNPHALHLEIGRNLKVDPLSHEVDFVVYGEFAGEAALTAFKNHETYQTSIKLVRHLRNLRISADFESR